MATVLSSRVNNCLKLFNNLIANDELSRYHDEIPANLWQDELGRFRVWAANIGAHQVDQSSLDYRLRDASHIRDQISSLLVALEGTIKYLEEVVAESPDDHEEELSDGGGTTEVQQIYSGLVDNINCLFRMSMLIRKPARHDRLLNFEKQVVVTYEWFDRQHVQGKFPDANRVVSDRLGNAISRRRADLKYRERHHKKLGRGIDSLHNEGLNPDHGAPSTYMSETIASDISNKFKEESNIQLDESGSNAGLSQTSYAQTMLEGRCAMAIPPPPKDSANGQPFECPYCFFITTIKNQASWARHVFRDIMPYVCIFPDCTTPNRLYDSRREWYGHLVSRHISPDSETSHICPLCNEESLSDRFLERHLGRHLQELALFALPRPDDDEEPDTDQLEDAFDPFEDSSVESWDDSGNDDGVIPDEWNQALKEQGSRRIPPKHPPSEVSDYEIMDIRKMKSWTDFKRAVVAISDNIFASDLAIKSGERSGEGRDDDGGGIGSLGAESNHTGEQVEKKALIEDDKPNHNEEQVEKISSTETKQTEEQVNKKDPIERGGKTQTEEQVEKRTSTEGAEAIQTREHAEKKASTEGAETGQTEEVEQRASTDCGEIIQTKERIEQIASTNDLRPPLDRIITSSSPLLVPLGWRKRGPLDRIRDRIQSSQDTVAEGQVRKEDMEEERRKSAE